MIVFQKVFMWLIMLTKRLYKKPSFVVIILLIPLLVAGYTMLADGESGVITVAIHWEHSDELSTQIVQQLKDSELIAFRECNTSQEAETLLTGGKVDAAWLFPSNITKRIQSFSEQPTRSNAFITVLERQDSVALMLSREKLNGVIYPYVAQQVYLNYMRQLAPELEHLSDRDLLWYYENTGFSDGLFAFEGAAGREEGGSYLLSPLRGILGTVILLCAVATAMYYIRDLQIGTFSWISCHRRYLAELGCQLVSNIHIAIICLISLAFAGLSGKMGTELLIVLLYALCCSFFAMTLRRLCASCGVLGMLMPILIVLVLVICPVFFDLGALRQLQYLLPPTYYINAIYNSNYIVAMLVYAALCMVIYFLLGVLRKQSDG